LGKISHKQITMTYLQGDIVLVPFPFSDQSASKPRPAIVISNSIVNRSKDIILAQITSNQRNDEYSFVLEDFMLTHKLHQSACEIRCHKIFIAEKHIVLNTISFLKKEKHKELITRIFSYIDIEEIR